MAERTEAGLRPSPGRHGSWTILFGVWSIAAVVRGALLVLAGDFDSDPDAYRVIAETLSVHGGFGLPNESGTWRPTAFRPPLYPWVLSWLVIDGTLSPWAVGVLHFVLGMATVTLAASLAGRFFCKSNGRTGNVGFVSIVMLVVACDPLLLWQSRLLMTETMATFLATLLWWLWVHGQSVADASNAKQRWKLSLPRPPVALACGVVFALAFLCRPTFLVQLGLLSSAIAAIGVRSLREIRSGRPKIGWPTCFVVSLCLVCQKLFQSGGPL